MDSKNKVHTRYALPLRMLLVVKPVTVRPLKWLLRTPIGVGTTCMLQPWAPIAWRDFPVNQHTDDVLQSVIWYLSKSSNIPAQTPGLPLLCQDMEIIWCALSTMCPVLMVPVPAHQPDARILTGLQNPAAITPDLEASTLCPNRHFCTCMDVMGSIWQWMWSHKRRKYQTGGPGDCSNQGSSVRHKWKLKCSLAPSMMDTWASSSVVEKGNSGWIFGDGSDIWEATHWDSIVHVWNWGIYRTNQYIQSQIVSVTIQLLVTDALKWMPAVT